MLAVALLGFRARGHLVDPDEYKPSGSLIAQVRANAPSRGPILITGHSFGFDASTTYALRLEGLGVGSPDARELGTSYAVPARHFAEVIEITESDRRPPPMSKVIGRVTLPSSPPRTVSVILRP